MNRPRQQFAKRPWNVNRLNRPNDSPPPVMRIVSMAIVANKLRVTFWEEVRISGLLRDADWHVTESAGPSTLVNTAAVYGNVNKHVVDLTFDDVPTDVLITGLTPAIRSALGAFPIPGETYFPV